MKRCKDCGKQMEIIELKRTAYNGRRGVRVHLCRECAWKSLKDGDELGYIEPKAD